MRKSLFEKGDAALKSKWKGNLITGIITIVLFLVYFSQTFSIRQTTLIKVTSTFIPRLCAGAGIFLGIVIVAFALRDRQAEAKMRKANEEKIEEEYRDQRAKTKAVIFAFIILLVGIFLIEFVGFVWGSAFYLMASFLLCSQHMKRNWAMFSFLTVVTPILIYITFAKGFNLRLPEGFLGLLGGVL